MSWIPDRYAELRALLRPPRIEDEVDEELAYHLEQRTRDLQATGLTAEQNVDSTGAAIPGSFRIQSTVTAGNPNLLPTTSDNFDLTAEYYFSKVGQITLSLFHKRLHNVVTNATVSTDLTNNGATFPVVLTTAVNSSDTGKVTGAEVSYQQVFDFLPGPLSGLGLQATYTYVKSSGVPQTTLSATDPDVAAGRPKI